MKNETTLSIEDAVLTFVDLRWIVDQAYLLRCPDTATVSVRASKMYGPVEFDNPRISITFTPMDPPGLLD